MILLKVTVGEWQSQRYFSAKLHVPWACVLCCLGIPVGSRQVGAIQGGWQDSRLHHTCCFVSRLQQKSHVYCFKFIGLCVCV